MPATAPRVKPVPVFIISLDRAPFLARAVHSIRRLSRPTEIIVQDNGSTDSATLELLAELEAAGIAVVRRPPVTAADHLNLIEDTIRAFFQARGERSRYVVTDCDIDLRIADPEALDVYDELLDRFRNVDCVGPMLRIRDIPQDYLLYNHVMNRQIEQFWSRLPSCVQTSRGLAAYLECTIDTTFALHRAGERFQRLKRALRVYEPYEALHLGWYRSDIASDVYAHASQPGLSHWNNASESDFNSGAALRFERYYAVRKTVWGSLELYEERLQSARR